MKKAIQIIIAILVIAFVAIQFVRPDFTNPPVVASESIESGTQIPDEVARILSTSCKDCHSNDTAYPWYSRIQPAAWFLADHITEGRRELNFSKWNTFEPRRKRKKLDEICNQVKSAEMPLPSYLWIHRDAALSESQIKTLCDWAEAEKAKIVD
ncbi:MAG: heme-binding domain-containing protein [Acidobacteria bacterium]|nr:heme-binding domain-containing protein [Acidobacteriota bacterium]